MARRHGSNLALLWLWYRLAAVAPIGSLACEPSYALGAALKRKKAKKKKKERNSSLDPWESDKVSEIAWKMFAYVPFF